MEIFLLVEELLQPVRQNDVRVVKAAIFFVKLVVLVILDPIRHAVVGEAAWIRSSLDHAATGHLFARAGR